MHAAISGPGTNFLNVYTSAANNDKSTPIPRLFLDRSQGDGGLVIGESGNRVFTG